MTELGEEAKMTKTITRRRFLGRAGGALLATSSLAFAPRAAAAPQKKTYRIAWSRYVGWEPWGYMEHAGILNRWANKYGVKIQLDYVDDYMKSVEQYAGGAYDGVAVTNMDALTVPAVGGVDSVVIIVGDFSNGNDGIVLRNGSRCEDIRGREIKLVELSVSHYLLARALEKCGMKEREVTLVNTSDRIIEAVFTNDSNPKAAVVTWNPMLMAVRNTPDSTLVFDSSQIPGEIIDTLVVRTNAPDTLKKALVGAWYETMTIMSRRGPEAERAIKFMAQNSAATVAQFKAQLATTAMFYNPADATAFVKSPELKQTMEYVRAFSFDHGLYGPGKPSKDYVGIQFPDGTVIGNEKNIKMRFDATYMQLAVDGRL